MCACMCMSSSLRRRIATPHVYASTVFKRRRKSDTHNQQLHILKGIRQLDKLIVSLQAKELLMWLGLIRFPGRQCADVILAFICWVRSCWVRTSSGFGLHPNKHGQYLYSFVQPVIILLILNIN